MSELFSRALALQEQLRTWRRYLHQTAQIMFPD